MLVEFEQLPVDFGVDVDGNGEVDDGIDGNGEVDDGVDVDGDGDIVLLNLSVLRLYKLNNNIIHININTIKNNKYALLFQSVYNQLYPPIVINYNYYCN